ncbi:T9SS type A sorting domain-containing protein [Flavobacterium sangjuense]|uniref:Secretion system C-terminal sorting domain-containing protein n=1 Tax=Flavobacterium sangjuense TaxID=2518177 RepID=A0A4P7PV80_9FLAO|nr:T9SS type A sorting domain-containing protein [Flavobacterium sangjuense]QBZ98879.1 hypothetical protein GS03_02391 [Flavobacterium sangjuense]
MKHPTVLLKQLAIYGLLFCNFLSVSAQDILWEKSYGGKHADYLFDVIPTPDYGFILAGSSLSKKTGNKTEDNRGDLDYWVWKMDEKGELDWQKSLGGSGQDMLQCILLTNDGGFLLAGSSESGEELDKKAKARGESDFWIIKLNAKGGEEWQKTIGGLRQDEINGVVRTKDGGFVLAGSSNSQASGEKITTNYGGMDYWVIKIDSKGAIVWQNTFGGIYNDQLRSIITTKDGGYLLGGSSNSPDGGTKTQKNIGQSDYWIIKIDEKGQEQWQKTIGGKGDDKLAIACETNDGNFILGGNSNSESGGDKRSSNESGTDFWVLKIEKDTKEILWQETYNVAKADILTSLVENNDKTILLGGYAQGEMEKKKAPIKQAKAIKGKSSVINEDPKMKKGTDDYVAIKISEKGEELWRKDVGSDGQDILIKAIETRDGGYLMAGTSKAILTSDGGIKATGNKSSGNGSNDFWVVKLKDKDKPKEAKKPVEAIPNPAMDYTNVIVGYDFTKGTATLVDMAGRVLQQFAITERTIPIELHGLPEGIYVVNIKTDKGNDGVKVIKQRKR